MELKKLMAVAADQQKLLDELLRVLERETVEMGNVDVAAMTKTNEEKEELLKKIADCSSVMQQAISAVATREGLPSNASLGSIAEHLARKGVEEPRTRQMRLQRSSDKVRQVAAINREIAERFAMTVTTSLNLISRLVNQSNFYGSSGSFQQRPSGAVMINREA